VRSETCPRCARENARPASSPPSARLFRATGRPRSRRRPGDISAESSECHSATQTRPSSRLVNSAALAGHARPEMRESSVPAPTIPARSMIFARSFSPASAAARGGHRLTNGSARFALPWRARTTLVQWRSRANICTSRSRSRAQSNHNQPHRGSFNPTEPRS